ncbi:hypothetical protein B0H13DRAFT_1860218 [Mycena leptocephala]|nr:hypothetical protein B0H13DRAFT_1860218 [Mycena leptocephala]
MWIETALARSDAEKKKSRTALEQCPCIERQEAQKKKAGDHVDRDDTIEVRQKKFDAEIQQARDTRCCDVRRRRPGVTQIAAEHPVFCEGHPMPRHQDDARKKGTAWEEDRTGSVPRVWFVQLGVYRYREVIEWVQDEAELVSMAKPSAMRGDGVEIQPGTRRPAETETLEGVPRRRTEEPPAQGPIGTLSSASAQGSQLMLHPEGMSYRNETPNAILVSRCDVVVDSNTTDDLAESSGTSTLLVALGKGTIETVAEDLAIIVVIPAGGRGFLGEAGDMASNWCQWFGEGNETGVFRARARGNGVIDEQEFQHPRDHGLLFMQCPRCNQCPGMMGEPFSAMTVVEKWMSLRPVLDVL